MRKVHYLYDLYIMIYVFVFLGCICVLTVRSYAAVLCCAVLLLYCVYLDLEGPKF